MGQRREGGLDGFALMVALVFLLQSACVFLHKWIKKQALPVHLESLTQ